MRVNKFTILSIIVLSLSVTLSLISVEILLRIRGYSWKTIERNRKELPMFYKKIKDLFEFDPILGWKNRQGNYLVPIDEGNSNYINVTILQGNLRAVQSQWCKKTKRIIILGGSCTYGWALSDDETYAWKLQQKFHSIEFLNYASAGYGTYQSLLVLERVFVNSPPPVMVLYGFIDHHECRNVGDWRWLKPLSELSTEGNNIYFPYCTIGPGNTLVRHPPETYPRWPLRKSLATVLFLEGQYARFKTRGRSYQSRAVTEKLLLEMNTLCKEKGSKLVVLLLGCKDHIKSHYIKFFLEKEICFIDFVHSEVNTPNMKIPHDGHPNELMNSFWANRIEKFIKNETY